MITHLSYPPSLGIIAFIDPKLCSVKYSSFYSVVDIIAELGQGAELGKVDIKNAFRLLPIYPWDFELLGFKFQGKHYYDKCLPMGCSLSCAIFEKFSTFLEWATVENSGLDTLSHYLDDFIFARSKGSGNCYNLMRSFQSICTECGIPLAVEKLKAQSLV